MNTEKMFNNVTSTFYFRIVICNETMEGDLAGVEETTTGLGRSGGQGGLIHMQVEGLRFQT